MAEGNAVCIAVQCTDCLIYQNTFLQTNFTFNLRAYGLEPEGQLTAVIPHLAAVIEVEINAINISVVLNELLVPTTG